MPQQGYQVSSGNVIPGQMAMSPAFIPEEWTLNSLNCQSESMLHTAPRQQDFYFSALDATNTFYPQVQPSLDPGHGLALGWMVPPTFSSDDNTVFPHFAPSPLDSSQPYLQPQPVQRFSQRVSPAQTGAAFFSVTRQDGPIQTYKGGKGVSMRLSAETSQTPNDMFPQEADVGTDHCYCQTGLSKDGPIAGACSDNCAHAAERMSKRRQREAGPRSGSNPSRVQKGDLGAQAWELGKRQAERAGRRRQAKSSIRSSGTQSTQASSLNDAKLPLASRYVQATNFTQKEYRDGITRHADEALPRTAVSSSSSALAIASSPSSPIQVSAAVRKSKSMKHSSQTDQLDQRRIPRLVIRHRGVRLEIVFSPKSHSGKRTKRTLEDMAKLDPVDHESLKMDTPTTIGPPKVITAPNGVTTLSGLQLRYGTYLAILAYLVLRDPTVHPYTDMLKPCSFAEIRKATD
ncbi:hypothetical protein BJ170DRAFT_722893 [Xylariales sp. AK1849]|nr:hypothetical protein BJ170DRAFT_722893 [Xylariales sp. AK1849]